MVQFQATPALLPPGHQGQHYAFLASAFPEHLINASSARREALLQAPPVLPPWFAAATDAQKNSLKTFVATSWRSMNELDKMLSHIQSAESFAQPLLESALKTAGHELDVHQVCLRLYAPVEDSFGRRTGAFLPKTFTLLQAALNNFEEPQTQAGYFDSASGFITTPDARGHFQRFATPLQIDRFARLCRDLDLGGKYQAYLKATLRPDNVVAEAILRLRYITAQKDAFRAAACMALMKGDISDSDFAVLMRVADGERQIRVDGNPFWYRIPCMMNLRLQGCLIIEPCVKHGYGTWFFAYFPQDPEHPIRRYKDFAEFRQSLTARLTAGVIGIDRSKGLVATAFQRYVSGFIEQKSRAYFFSRLSEQVVDAPPQPFGANWLRSEQGAFLSQLLVPAIKPLLSLLGDPLHTVRVPVEGPDLNINGDAIKGLWDEIDLWHELYEGQRERMFNDATAQAIATVQADAHNRSIRLSHYLAIGMVVVGAVSMAIPPLGYLMLAATAGQLMYETLEGAVELGEGDREAGWAHLGDVLENLVSLGAGAAALHFTVSPFIEGMKAVKLPNGEARLWKPDIAAYERSTPPPAGSKADANGLHLAGQQRIVELEGRFYNVTEDAHPDKYRIEHPGRPNAYQPRISHNGMGGWVHEAERPLTWQGAPLMRRLGPTMATFSDTQLEQIRRTSNVGEDVLRRLHGENQPAPAILLDTAQQFKAYDEMEKIPKQIQAGEMSSELAGYAAVLTVELPGWPVSLGIEVFDSLEPQAMSVCYGEVADAPQALIRISREELMAGRLPERVTSVLTDEQLHGVLGQHVPPGAAQRSTLLQQRLVDRAMTRRSSLFESIYSERMSPADPAIAVLQRDFKGLPNNVALELLEQAQPEERLAITSKGKLPLRLAEQARQLQRQLRLTRAFEGLYLEALANPDTEALVLHSLENLPGWQDDIRLEVRDSSFRGELRASLGVEGATTRKVLARLGDGRYQAFDGEGNELHGINGLYGALQHALTDSHRDAIGLPHVGLGEQLKVLISQNALSREQLRVVLRMQPQRKPLFRFPHRLPGGKLGYPLSGRGGRTGRANIRARVRELYRSMTDAQLEEYLLGRDLLNDRWLIALEREFETLDDTLTLWMERGPRDRASLRLRRRIYEVIIGAWRKSGPADLDFTGRYRGQRILFKGETFGAHLETLPPLPGNFDHVSSVMLLRCDVSDQGVSFLSTFRALRILAVEDGRLTRLPVAVAQMPFLEYLGLSDNEIVLTLETAEQIRNMTRMVTLSLEGNPLVIPVNISRMSQLHALHLGGSELSGWPVGLFSMPRPEGFALDLTGNELTELPDVAPGSERARLVARTFVTRGLLPPDILTKLKLYFESVGLDPERRFPPRGTVDSAHWMTGLTPQAWLYKQEVWNALEEEPGSESFFDELRKLSQSSDAATPEFKIDLTLKVWRMLDAMAADTALREQVFEKAVATTSCVDAGAQAFNAMGIMVLEAEANAIASEPLKRLELLALAKGKWRLDELGRIANARVSELLAQGRQFPQYDADGLSIDPPLNQRYIDEVEIHMVYPTRLAARLDLPWQSRSMMFREPDVTEPMLEAARQRVLALEEGDLLRNNLVEQPVWSNYLKASAAYADAVQLIEAKGDALTRLICAQREWSGNGRLSFQQKFSLRQTIEAAGQELGMPPAQLEPGQVMSEQAYDAQMESLGLEHKHLLYTLTDQMMGRIR